MATASDLQQLYVGYFGRAADQTGLNFWMEAINNGGLSLANVHASFVQSEEFQAQYEGLSSGDLVAQVYLNVLGRPADAAGQEFWTNALNNGLITEDQLIEGVLSGLSARDALIISNKVTVANYYTAVRGAEYNQTDKTTSGDILLGVNAETASVATALNTIATTVEGPGASSDQLAAALVSLQAAIDARDAYAEAVVKATGTDDPLTDNVTEAGDALTQAVTTAFGNVNAAIGSLAAQLDPSDSAAVTRVKLNDATTAAGTAVTQAQNAVNAVTGLSAASKTYLSALSTYESRQEAAAATQLEQDAELARFNVVNASNVSVGAGGVVTGIIEKNSSNELVVLDSYLNATGRTQVQKDAAAALLADIKADLAADSAAASALKAVTDAASKVASLDSAAVVNADGYTLDAGKVADLLDAREAQTALAEAIVALTEANTAAAEFVDLTDAISAAGAAIAELGFAVVGVADGSNGLGNAAADEVFIFTGTAATGAATLADFSGDDVLFVGNGYVLGADSDPATAGIQGGNNAALEVFFTQVGADAVVSIETSPFGSSAATPEFQQITLTGVTVEQLSFDANTGFVSVA